MFFFSSTLLPSVASLNAEAFTYDGYEGYIPVEDNSIDSLLRQTGIVVNDQEGTLANPIIGNKEAQRDEITGVFDYTVEEGDTLESIAQRFELKPSTIVNVNHVRGDRIRPGDTLKILPVDGFLHVAERNESLKEVAKKFTVDPSLLAEQNSLTEQTILQKGEYVILPGIEPKDFPDEQPLIVQVPDKPVNDKQTNKKAELKQDASEKKKQDRKKELEQIKAPKRDIVKKKDFDVVTERGSRIVWPAANPVITQRFHYGHPGIDIANVSNPDHTTAIVASAAGTVIQAAGGYNGGYGNVVVVDHGNGMQTRYAHLREIYVSKGQSVRAGQAVEWMGRTGRVYGRTGLHLHYEVIVNKKRINPMSYL